MVGMEDKQAGAGSLVAVFSRLDDPWTSSAGGAFHTMGHVTVSNSTFSGNVASIGSAI